MPEAAGQEAKGRIAPIVSLVLLVADIVATLSITAWVLVGMPACFDMFRELEVELPLITRLVVSIPRGLYVVVAIGTIGGLLAKEVLVRQQSVRAAVNAIVAIALALVIVILAAAVYWPLWITRCWLS
jgi:hypothetical protein